MRRLALLLMLASCSNPDEIFPVRGLVRSPELVEGQVVRLLRNMQVVDPADFTSCQPSAATPFKETVTSATGRYRFDIFRVEAQSLSGFERYCFRVDTTFASGSTASSDFEAIRFETVVATLSDWRAEPRLENGTLFFEPPVPLPDEFAPVPTQLNHRAQVVTGDGRVVWQVDDRFREPVSSRYFREPMIIDGVRLEDFAGEVVLRAELHPADLMSSGLGGTNRVAPVELMSGTRLAVSGAQTPVSRGLPCPPFAAPCPLSDGDLTAVDGHAAQAVSFELPARPTLSAIVLRGLEAGNANVGVQLMLEDGGVATLSGYVPTNSAFGESSMAAPLVLPDGGLTISNPAYVAIAVDAGVVLGVTLHFPEGLTRIQEVSLFE